MEIEVNIPLVEVRLDRLYLNYELKILYNPRKALIQEAQQDKTPLKKRLDIIKLLKQGSINIRRITYKLNIENYIRNLEKPYLIWKKPLDIEISMAKDKKIVKEDYYRVTTKIDKECSTLIYIDGLKIEGQVGVGAYIQPIESKELELSQNLGQNKEVLDAKAIALYKALEYVTKKRLGT